ncbi:MAG TPA: ATP-binding cassette domain-containing protein [Chitinophagaceae bacterium]
MKVSLTDAGKRFNRDWIFRHFTYIFESGVSYAITGPNGSGKSTLLQAISGSLHLNEGRVEFNTGPTVSIRIMETPDAIKSIPGKLPDEEQYSRVSICAPYLEVVEEMTFLEFLAFHGNFKPWLDGITPDKIAGMVGLEKARNKQIRYYSSGMKQRVKLAQCIFSATPIVLLDEPCTNLDAAGIALYHQLIQDHCRDRLVIVSSNDEVEYKFCKEKIDILQYK